MLTSQQDIPERPKVQESWTFRRLLPPSVVNALSKTIVNVFDALLIFMILIAGIAELFGHSPSWFFWGFATLVLAADFEDRHKSLVETPKKDKH